MIYILVNTNTLKPAQASELPLGVPLRLHVHRESSYEGYAYAKRIFGNVENGDQDYLHFRIITLPDVVKYEEGEWRIYVNCRHKYELTPQEVDVAQLRVELSHRDYTDENNYTTSMLQEVDGLVAQASEEVQIWWSRNNRIERTSPNVLGIIAALGLTEQEADDIFKQAALRKP